MKYKDQLARRRRLLRAGLMTILAAIGISGCQSTDTKSPTAELVGSWRAKVQFADGPYASIKDLEFMYLFHSDGTMLESSNYDAAPPVPPAYGNWRAIGEHKFETQYAFYITRYPDSSEQVPEGTGWLPGGHGILIDTISIGSDEHTFSSRTHLTMYNISDSVTGVSLADGRGMKMKF